MRWLTKECAKAVLAIGALALGKWWLIDVIVRGPVEQPAPRASR